MPIVMVEKQYEDDILHYGVKGMKWGVRKAIHDFRSARADKRIRTINANKKIRDVQNSYHKEELRLKYANKPKKTKTYNKKLHKLNRSYEADKAVFDMNIAKNKAIKDRNYKKTAQYRRDVERGKEVLRRRAMEEFFLGYARY